MFNLTSFQVACLQSAVLYLLCTVSACGRPGSVKPTDSKPAESTKGKAFLLLNEIVPIPQFPPPKVVSDKAVSSEADPRAVRYLRKGRQRFEEQLWAESISTLEKSLQFDPNLIEARILLARAGLQLGNFGLAENNLHEVLKHRPRDVSAHLLLGEIASKQNHNDLAIRSLRLALRAGREKPQSPEVVLAHLLLSQALIKEGYLTAAADELERYLETAQSPTPQMTQYHELREIMVLYRGKAAGQLGDILTQLKFYDRAVSAYRRALSEHPGDPAMRKQLAFAVARSGNAEKALAMVRAWLVDYPQESQGFDFLKKICDLLGQPKRYDVELVQLAKQVTDPAMRVHLAKMLLKRHKTDAAVRILERSMKDQSVDKEVRYLLARLTAERGEYKKSYSLILDALAEFPESIAQAQALLSGKTDGIRSDAYFEHSRTIARQRPNDAYARYAWGLMLCLHHQPDQAIVELQAAIHLKEDLGPAHVLLARLYRGQKQWRKVIDTAESAIAQGVRLSDVYYYKGLAHEALGEIDDAETALLDAFRLDQKSAKSLYSLAESAERRGDRRRSEQFYRRILDDVDPRYTAAREKLVRLYINTGKPSKAREYFSDFQRLGQKGPAVQRCRAMLALTTSTAPAGEPRLNEYRTALQKIIDSYPRDAATYLDMAKSYFAVNRFQDALKYTQRVLTLQPDDIPARELKATLLAKTLEFDRAAETIHGLLKDRPSDLEYLQKLLEFAYDRGDNDEAVKLLKQMLDRDDLQNLHDRLTSRLITTLMDAKRLDEAAQTAKQWLDDSPEDIGRQRIYLATLNRNDHFDAAVAAARQYLAADPTNRDLQIQLLGQLQAAKKYIEAQQLTLSWLAESPDDIDMNGALIRLCWSAGQWDDAINIALNGIEQTSHRAQYENWLGRSYLFARRYDDAVDFYRNKAETLKTKQTYRALLAVLIEAERYDEAERVVNKLMRPLLAAKESGRAFNKALMITLRTYLVEIFQDTHRNAQALQQLEEIHTLDPQDPLINNNLGYTWADAGIHLDRAEEMIRFALSADPRSYANIDSLGWVMYKKGKMKEAIVHFRHALRMTTPEDPVILDHLADALYRFGKTKEAREQWLKASKLCAPDHDPPPNHDERQLYVKLQEKLKQMEAGQEVETAKVVGDSAAAHPAENDKK